MIFHMFLGQTVKLFISTSLVTTLIFPHSIEQIIGGWNKLDVYKYVSKDKKTLVVKSLREELNSNLTVITSGGVYQFNVSTNDKPHSFVQIVNGSSDLAYKLEKETKEFTIFSGKSTIKIVNKLSTPLKVNESLVQDKVTLPKGSPIFINNKREVF